MSSSGGPALLLLVAVTGAAALAVARSGPQGAPTGDMAVIESYTMQAAEGRLLDGPYSRFQWHHPGPLYFYLQVPFYAASARRTSGLSAGALTINLTALSVLIWIAFRRGRQTFAAAVVACCGLYVLRINELLTSAWNPHVVVLPAMALILAAAGALDGLIWCVPAAVFVSSLVAQTHVGLVPLAGLLGIVSVAALVPGRSPRSSSRHIVIGAIAAAVIGAAGWSLPIVQQATRTPGNMTALWRFFVGGGIANAGQPFRVAFVAWADMLSGLVRPDFLLAHGSLFKRSHTPWTQAYAIGQMTLLLLATWIYRRNSRRFECSLAISLFSASLLALWAVTRIDGEIMDHEIFWISGIGALNAAVAVDAVATLVVPAWRAPDAGWPRVLAVGVLIICSGVGLNALAGMRANPESSGILRAAQAIREYLDRHDHARPLVKIDQDSWSLAAGVLLQLQRAGVGYAVDEDWVPMFNDARTTGKETIRLSIAGERRHVQLMGQPGTAVVVESAPVFVDALR